MTTTRARARDIISTSTATVFDNARFIGIATNSPILSLLSLNNELYTQGGQDPKPKAVERRGDGDDEGVEGGDEEDVEGDKVDVADMEQGG